MKENEKYSIKRESIIKEISEEAKTGNSLIGKIGLGVLKELSHAGEITQLSENIANNKNWELY